MVQTPRPPSSQLACGEQQVHLNEKTLPPLTWPVSTDPTGPRFAMRVQDFDGAVARLQQLDYQLTDDATDPMRLVPDRTGLAGFPQAFLVDPDGNLIEINAEGLD